MKIIKNIYNYYSKQGLKAIQILVEYQEMFSEILPEFVCPIALVYIEETLNGYLMEFIKGINLKDYLADSNVDFKEKIHTLQNVGQVVNKTQKIKDFPYSFSFGDLHEKNIIVTQNRNIKIIDSNGVSLFKVGINSKYLNHCESNLFYGDKYQRDLCGDFIATIDTDILCYVMIIMNFISKSDFSKFPFYKLPDYLKYLKENNFPSDFLNCIERLYSEKNNINPYPYLEDITEEMVEKANIKTYINSQNSQR